MEDIRNLEPKSLWGHFYSLTQIPRPSGHLEKIQQYLLDNKNLLANITADNIKYNNANLRYMIGRG